MPAKKEDWSAVGRTIKCVRPMTAREAAKEGWSLDRIDGPPAVIELDDGSKLYPSRDPEGNGPGAMFGTTPRGQTIILT